MSCWRSRRGSCTSNLDPTNIRNIADYGGGAVMDIGCYPINVARWFFGGEPTACRPPCHRDPTFGTDVLTSAVLDFGGRQATFTCATQLEPDQRVHLLGTTGRLEVEIPFNIPPDLPTRVVLAAGGDPPVAPDLTVFELPPCDQYTVQGDAFSRAVSDGLPAPTPPEDAIGNMRVIEQILATTTVVRSARRADRCMVAGREGRRVLRARAASARGIRRSRRR